MWWPIAIVTWGLLAGCAREVPVEIGRTATAARARIERLVVAVRTSLVGIGVLAGLPPAAPAARLDPRVSLRAS